MKIFVDFDSTLNDLDEKWVREINLLSGTNYSILDIDTWDWFFKKNEPRIALQALKNIYLKTEPLEGAKEFLNELSTICDIAILTATEQVDDEFIELKNKHIRWMFGAEIEIIHEIDKFIYADEQTILIDDKTSSILDFINAGGKGIIFSKDEQHQYNKVDCRSDNCRRIGSYNKIVELIKNSLTFNF